MSEKDKTCKPLKGVCCDACNCIHHGEDNCCQAGQITVGPHNACCSSETICSTFKPKDETIG